MAILYTVIARGTTILARYASCAGNFQEVCEQILEKISNADAKMTYSHGNFLFHYICDERIVYLAITEDDFKRSRAFQYLGDIKKKFRVAYGKNVYTALPYSMDTDFASVLSVQMKRFSSPEEEYTKVNQVQGQLDELKDIMVKNIDSIASRGENLHLLVDKTEDLSENAVTFKKRSTNLARSLRWKNIKLTVFLIVVGIIVLYGIVSAACGGLNWPNCIHHSNGTNTP